METLILGWYVLVETGSLLWLTIFASLQFLGTLLAPLSGVIADRLGRRTMLCVMRALYTLLAASLAVLALTDVLTPYYVFGVAFVAGLIKPSDLVMRNSLIGDTMPTAQLMNAMGISRTTMDSARIAGALIGAGLFSQLGIGVAYVVVTAFYLTSFALTFGVSRARPAARSDPHAAMPSPWRELKDGLSYVFATPTVLAVMLLAFLVNVTAYPLTHALLPYVAKEVYVIDENGLSHLVAAFATGALIGSIVMAALGSRRPARVMVINILLWFAFLAVFGQMESKLPGFVLLLICGFFQSMAMVSMSVTLLYATATAYRGRVMGVRMLVVYGLPVGLLTSAVLIEWLGFSGMAAVYSGVGMLACIGAAVKWRRILF
jgi:predicted MFS family arabinose efflux permease